MNMRQICASLMVCALVGTSSLGANQAHGQIPHTSAMGTFSQAMGYYELGKWPAAYGKFAVLADHGDADAARIALFMHRFGPRLYGSAWDASEYQLEHWLQLASQQMENKIGAFNSTNLSESEFHVSVAVEY
ncbi:MAG: hypothetical protein WCH60_19570 [Burkholderiales bacterium]